VVVDVSTLTQSVAMKILIQFTGGFRDGTTLEGDTDEPRSAAAYPFLTDNCTIGKRVSEMPPERRKQIQNLISPPEKQNARKKAAEEFKAILSSNTMNQFQIEAALHEMESDIESRFPRSPDLYSRISKFRRVVYEIVAREMGDDCIHAEAVHVGDDPEIVLPEWPPEAR